MQGLRRPLQIWRGRVGDSGSLLNQDQTILTQTLINSSCRSKVCSWVGAEREWKGGKVRRQSSSMRSEQTETPTFPPSLTSMEPTKSELS